MSSVDYEVSSMNLYDQ